jgi:uncharacterized RmlC-like cupin family protein
MSMKTVAGEASRVAADGLSVTSLRGAGLVAVRQGQRFVEAIARDRCGSTGISGGLVVMPPMAVSKTHLHGTCESVVVIVEGWAATLGGDGLRPVFHGPGDFLYIPGGVAHVAVNLSATHRVVAIELRTEGVFNEDLRLLPTLDERAGAVADELRRGFAEGTLPLPAGWQDLVGRPFDFDR